MRLFLILLVVPIIEIALFIELGGLIGTWPTIAIVVLTAIIGTVMLRQQGLSALRSVQARLASGENPGRLLADGAMILVAGALLVTPGFFTDAVGLGLLVPAVRGWIWKRVSSRLTVIQVAADGQHPAGRGGAGPAGTGSRRAPSQAQTVEGEWEEIEDPDPFDRRREPDER